MTDISPRTPCSDRSALQRVPLIGTKATADFHQGAQRSCCKSDAAYRAAAEITPASPEKPLPRRSHPYRVRGQWRAYRRSGQLAQRMENCSTSLREVLGRGMTRIAMTLSAIGRDTWRNPITFFLVWVPSLTVLILSVNPSLTADLAPFQRIAFWLLHVALLLPLLMIAQNLIDEALAAFRLSPVILVTLTALCASVVFAPVSLLLDLLFSPAPDLGSEPSLTLLLIDEITALALPTLCAWLLVNGARLTMLSVPMIQEASSPESEAAKGQSGRDPAKEAGPASGLTDIERAFWSRVPRELGAELVSLSAEQHYLHVVTTKGRSLRAIG